MNIHFLHSLKTKFCKQPLCNALQYVGLPVLILTYVLLAKMQQAAATNQQEERLNPK